MSTPPHPKAEANGHPPPPLRVLVVDDCRDAADSLGLLLSVLGHEVRTAYEGPTALQIAGSFLPQVVFLDLALPKMNGLQVARQLRERAQVRDAMLVAMTGYGQEEYRCREAGFAHFLLKPLDLAEVERVLAEHAASRPATAVGPEPGPTPAARGGSDPLGIPTDPPKPRG